MFGDMKGKIEEMKKLAEDTKERLNNVSVSGTMENGKLRIVANANRRITDIFIEDELLQKDKEELIDLLITATNRALEDADTVNEQEVQSATKNILPPGFPGL